jgi:hypothetical protein
VHYAEDALFLVDADQPQDRLTARSVGVRGDLPRCLLRLDPLALELDAAILDCATRSITW